MSSVDRPASGALGIGALATAIAAVVIGAVATPIELTLQLRGGAPFSTAVFAIAVVIVVVAVVALVIGIVAVRRRQRPTLAAAGIGIAAFLLVGQLAGAVAAVIAYAS